MSDGWEGLAKNPRLNSVASVVIGALLIGLNLMSDASPLAIPSLALLFGGGLLFGAGILGVWQPERYGLQPRNPWLGVLNGVAVLLLLAALALQLA